MQNLDATLAKLAEKFGTTVEQLFPILVAKERLDAIVCVGVALILWGIAKPLWKRLYPIADIWDDGKGAAVASGLVGFSLILLIVTLCAIGSISTIVYPEAAVIKSLLGK